VMLNTIALPSFVLAYHGCDRSVAEEVFSGGSDLRASENDYDWLGHGIYFWEHNPVRALDWAAELKRRGREIKKPAVIGAIIDLGKCLNLLDSSCIELVKEAYFGVESIFNESGRPLPENRIAGDAADFLLRRLDCAVINRALELNPDFDTVRAVFTEGQRIYPGAGFHEKSHIQICARRLDSIVAYFRVRGLALK